MKRKKFVFVLCFITIYVYIFWERDIKEMASQNLAIKFCDEVMEFVIPGLRCGVENSDSDVFSLAVIENEKMEKMIAENEDTHLDLKEEYDYQKELEKENEMAKEVTKKKGEKVASVNRKKLNDFDYLRQTFYQVDCTTTVNSKLLNAKTLLKKDLMIKNYEDKPTVLIYHTHSQEGYRDSKKNDESTTVVGVGDRLCELLETKYGINVLHHKGEYDVGDRDHAYSKALPKIQKILKDNPSIQVVIDLHRDGVANDTKLVTTVGGKKMAQVMFFNGLSRTTKGEIAYLKNPYIKDNLAFSLQMQIAAAEYYPGFTRRIYLKGYRYNMHVCPKTLLVEVGAQTNTVEEAMNSMEPLADILSKTIVSGQSDGN